MTIHVTQEHIRKGERGCCENCPVALAIQELTGDRRWRVGSSKIWRNGEMRRAVDHPQKVHRFVVKYDQGKKPRPFTFDLDL